MNIKTSLIALSLALPLAASAQFGQGGNPFAVPPAFVHYAPDRTCKLIDVSVDLKVDWPARAISGIATTTMSALRDGIETIMLNAGEGLAIETVTVDGAVAKFTHKARILSVSTAPTKRGQKLSIAVRYHSVPANPAAGLMGFGGFHWLQPDKSDAKHIGFWTQGETESNSDWVPTWDYPNDMATNETRTTVPADWDVIGNGNLISTATSADGKWKTYDWKLTIPCATYLMTICGGPFDIKKDTWRGIPLWYVVPRGKANLIDDSFSDTPDILSFYSDILGYKYPWSKLAMDAVYEFGGGMENVSAITLGAGALTDKREGFRNMASLNAHEIGHEWFGDTVTCKDWGHIWLSESFATYMQFAYFEHSRGQNGYDREIEDAMQQYFSEAKRYKRALDTNVYQSADSMFDNHTYPKGGVILHTLRKQLGDKNFYNGLNLYLTTNQHTPVESVQLCKAFTDATGLNQQFFWDQWINKPGHPVLDYSWKWDDAAKKLTLTVKQTQDTKDGTPIYTIPAKVGIVAGGKMTEQAATLNAAMQDFSWTLPAKPDAVVLDPHHEFLREIPKHEWSATELPAVVTLAPNCIDRSAAMDAMLSGKPSDEAVQIAVDALKADNSAFPAFLGFPRLVALQRESLRPFFMSQLNHLDFERRASAVRGLSMLAANAATTQVVRGYVNDEAPYAVVASGIEALAKWDAKGNMDLIAKAATMSSNHEVIRQAAFAALATSKTPESIDLIVKSASKGSSPDLRRAAINAMGSIDAKEPKTHQALVDALAEDDFQILFSAVSAAQQRKDESLVPALIGARDRQKNDQIKGFIQQALDQIRKVDGKG